MQVKVVSPVNQCAIQVNMTYDEMSDLIYACAANNRSRSDANKILRKFQDALNGAAKEIDGE